MGVDKVGVDRMGVDEMLSRRSGMTPLKTAIFIPLFFTISVYSKYRCTVMFL